MIRIAFWQRIVSPHMGHLARALAYRGHDVTYVAEQAMSPDRIVMGWNVPDIAPARVIYASCEHTMLGILQSMPGETIHLTQGLRANGGIGSVQKVLAKEGSQHWVLLETVDDMGIKGAAKRIAYRWLLREFLKSGDGILAIGEQMPRWIGGLGVPHAKSVPFAYFLSEEHTTDKEKKQDDATFNIIFVGQLIERKRVQDVLLALARHASDWSFRLTVVGDGPEGDALRALGERLLPGRIDWLGMRLIEEVPQLIEQSDLLILPSRHDGWGAVVSEALILGTPAVCSDRCGAAGVVRASKVGGVFPVGHVEALSALVLTALSEGRVTAERRAIIARWSKALGAERGAEYLETVLQAASHDRPIPPAPWLEAMERKL